MVKGKIVMGMDAEAVYSFVAITHRLHVVAEWHISIIGQVYGL